MINTSVAMTNEYCYNYCYSQGYSVAGTQFKYEHLILTQEAKQFFYLTQKYLIRYQCFCGNQTGGSQLVAQTQCNMVCYGSSIEMCGASLRSSIYSIQGIYLLVVTCWKFKVDLFFKLKFSIFFILKLQACSLFVQELSTPICLQLATWYLYVLWIQRWLWMSVLAMDQA
jgi:hypothetical protein